MLCYINIYINLNTNFLNNIGNKWLSKINFHTWIVGGNYEIYNILVNETYQNEIVSPSTSETTYDAKVGLMYVSDMGYASAPSLWNGYIGGTPNKLLNWMYMGYFDWTISPASSDSYHVFYLSNRGHVNNISAYGGYGSRPVVYLKASVLYAGGSGTKDSPITLVV